MTNKEKYKQAFSVLHPSGRISVEVEKMTIRKKTKRLQTAIAFASVCLLLACGTGIAYAADAGGIQRNIQLWIEGDRTNAVMELDGNGNYILHVDPSEQGTEGDVDYEVGGGGVAIEDDGRERPLTGEELLESLNDPVVKYEEDGTAWVYYYDQKIDITDRFEDGICYVKLSNGKETLYMTVKYQDGWCTSPHKYISPDSL